MAEGILRHGARVGVAEARAVQRFRLAANRRWSATLGLLCLLVVAGVLALMLGSVAVPPETIVRILLAKLGLASSAGYAPGQETIVLQIRLPRLLLADPAWKQVSAIKNKRFLIIPDENVAVRPGPRIASGLEAVAKGLHPDQFK